MTRNRILIGIGAVGAAVFLLGVGLESFALRLGAKAIPILCLLLWLWPPHERHTRWISAGLVLSLVGDLLLELGPRWFLPGLGAFLLAHLAYVVAYLALARAPRLPRAAPFALLALGAGVFLWPGLGEMALPVVAYIVVICTMMWRASALMGVPSLARREQWAALVGAILFAMSDSLLAFKLFVSPVPGSSYVIILLYWAGQLGIASSARAPRPIAAPAPIHAGLTS